jgi:hypothetical protein
VQVSDKTRMKKDEHSALFGCNQVQWHTRLNLLEQPSSRLIRRPQPQQAFTAALAARKG